MIKETASLIADIFFKKVHGFLLKKNKRDSFLTEDLALQGHIWVKKKKKDKYNHNKFQLNENVSHRSLCQ